MEKNNINISISINDSKMSNQKKKLLGISFVRACSSLGIVVFHYFSHSRGKFKLLYGTANSSWGFMFATTFFCISGTVLYYNYAKIQSLKKFYYKRWKSIFPAYYICFIFFFLNTAFEKKKLFYKAHWTKLFLTLFGLDGYLSYRINTYHIVGEWFLGVIIIIYALYPLLIYILDINIFIIYLILLFCYFLMYKTSIFIIERDRNLITCIFSFYFGIISIKFKKIFLKNKIFLVFSLFLFILLYTIKININAFIIIFQLQGFSLYIIFFQFGEYIMSKGNATIFQEISKISFSIYLIQHRIIFDVLGLKNPIQWYSHIILLGITILLILICSKIHFMVVDSVIKSDLFKKIDAFFLLN